jgi:signal peptidase II
MLYAIVAVLVLIADQWLKYWVTANVVLDTGSIELIPGFIKLVNIHNDGATLGMLSGARWLFVALAVVFTAVVVLALAKRIIRGSFGRWMAVLALAGALGNCIDRVMFGYVVDMFRLEPSFLSWFGIFNIADIFITVCGILFCFYLIFGGKKEKPAPAHRHGAAHAARREREIPEPAETPVQPEPAAAPIRNAAPAAPASDPAAPESPAEDEEEPEHRSGPKHTRHAAEKSAPRHDGHHVSAPAAPAERGDAGMLKPSVSDGASPAKPADDDMDFSLDDILDEFK